MKTNFINKPDEDGQVYCRRLNEIITLDEDAMDKCRDCKFLSGVSDMGDVECYYDAKVKDSFLVVYVPQEQYDHMNQIVKE